MLTSVQSLTIAFAFLPAVVGSFALISSAYSYNLGDPFIDVTENSLYSPHITSLSENRFITGDFEDDGAPAGTFRPTEVINRAEFSKVTVLNRLAEEYGEEEEWMDMSFIKFEDRLRIILLPYYKCLSSGCFTDVAVKTNGCDSKGRCKPWYTQYIYYLADMGMVRGTGGGKFSPTANIKRIHALKMLMVDNGDIAPSDDSRYQDLLELTESRNSTYPKCLGGAETEILKGNNTKLLTYALLADRLDFFGNDCQLLKSSNGIMMSSAGIANYLNAPMTRQEVTRFLALSSFYEPIAVNPKKDDTVNTGWQNWRTDADEDYQMPDAGVDESKYFNEDDSSTTRPGQFDDESEDSPVHGPVDESEEEELKYETYPDSSCSGDYGPYMRRTHYGDPIDLGRDNTKEQVMDYIGDMENDYRVNDSKIDYWLKQCGLWEVVEDERGDKKPKIPTLKDALYNDYNNYVNKKGYTTEETCKLALRSTAYREDKTLIARSWCTENGINLNETKWKVFQYMYIYYLRVVQHTALETCVHVYTDDKGKVKPQPKLGYILDWCASEDVSKRDIQNEIDIDVVEEDENETISKNELRRMLDEKFALIMDLERAKTWGMKQYDEDYQQEIVIEWYEEVKSCNINIIYGAEGDAKFTFTSVWEKITGQKNEDKDAIFSIAKEKVNVNQYRSSGQPTFILIHGWKSDPYVWAEDMGKLILDQYHNNVQVLAIDWREIVSEEQDGGLSPDISSTWIESVAEVTVKALSDWQIDPSNTTIISHSLGALLSEEISKKLGNGNDIILDPAESIFLEYKITTDGDTFNGFSGNERCIIGAHSILGSESSAKDCREKYLIDYYDSNGYTETKDFVKDVSVNLVEKVIVDKAKSIINASDVAWKIFYTESTDLVSASLYIDGTNVKVADVEVALSQYGLNTLADAGCVLASAGTGPFAPVTATACTAIAGAIINKGVHTVVSAFSEHEWVHQTYSTIIENPFHDNVLSLNNKSNFTDMDGGWFNIDHDGMIYTEDEQSKNIKYLKTISKTDSSKYALYGNAQSNNFECIGKKKCEMYGSYGNDKFYQHYRDSTFSIEDFKSNNGDGDRLFLRRDLTGLEAQSGENGLAELLIKCGTEFEPIHCGTITLNGPSFREVDEWVSIADGSYRETEEGERLETKDWKKMQENNPIQFIK